MNYQSNQVTVKAVPPIERISINKHCVIFDDREMSKTVKFNDNIEAKKFLNWLVTV